MHTIKQRFESIRLLKGRESRKGFIVLIADWVTITGAYCSSYEEQTAVFMRHGWFCHLDRSCSPLTYRAGISGDQNTIAIRMSTHPIAMRFATVSPLISTSANFTGQPPAVTQRNKWFNNFQQA